MSNFSLTIQLNSTFTDLDAFAAFSARLRDLMAPFSGVVMANPAASAPVVEVPATASVPSFPPAGTEPKGKVGRPKKTETAPALPLEAPTSAATADFAPIVEAPTEPVQTAPVVEAPKAPPAPETPASAPAASPAAATGTFPAKTLEDCRALIVARVPKNGPKGAQALMRIFADFGVKSISTVPAERLGEIFARIDSDADLKDPKAA